MHQQMQLPLEDLADSEERKRNAFLPGSLDLPCALLDPIRCESKQDG